MAKVAKKANRTQVVDKLAVVLGTSKTQSEKYLNAVLDIVKELVVDEYDVNLTGFGSFHQVKRKARQGINPKTGQKMQIKASKSVGFKVGKTFKESVKES